MKKIFLLISILSFAFHFAFPQKVDSIKVEQVGDFIKIRYLILNSNPNQIFRVKVMFSLDGGLNQEPKTISGDIGDIVSGGKPEYWVLWDVLKDVPEIKSIEFFVRAELIRDLAVISNQANPPGEQLKFWQKKRFIGLVCFESPGPKAGFRIGYLGNFGVSVQFAYGKIPVNEEYENNQYFSPPHLKPALGIDLTKRIVNKTNFQIHLAAGIKNTDLMTYFAGPPTPQFWLDGMTGPEVGMVFIYKKAVASIMYSYLNPKQLEKNDDKVVIASPYRFLNIGIGLKF